MGQFVKAGTQTLTHADSEKINRNRSVQAVSKSGHVLSQARTTEDGQGAPG